MTERSRKVHQKMSDKEMHNGEGNRMELKNKARNQNNYTI